ncbi:hypothetical protein FA048_14715 [Pedobacter polaris]|uniref:Uncharacterized protein n=1 Tax=Pedobacter polaris TaxID=2571273 RepID=A0A4U1CNV8_9SPHI|nr:hypothetical protein [Pedobacter polaris]TKC08403.1 hypothetical protein FA048_14715 [Pedobacter polaris]
MSKPISPLTKTLPSTITISNNKGLEFITTDSLAGTSKKTRFWLQGNSFYLQSLISTKDELTNEQGSSFFNSVKAKTSEPLFDLSSSKAKLIVADLASKNPETHQKALGALSFYKFELDELPSIYTALQQPYTDDTTSNGARCVLLGELAQLNDAQTPAFLKKLYQDSKGLDLIQSQILAVLPVADSTSYDWYFKTLSEAPTFKLKSYWDLFEPLTDSISFVAANIDQVLKLGKEDNYRPVVLDLVATMLDSDNITTYQALLNSKKEVITAHTMQDLAADFVRVKEEKYPVSLNYYLDILPKLNVPTLTDNFTKKVIALDTIPYLITNAVAARIKANLPVDPKLLTSQLDSLDTRYAIMHAYEKTGKIAEVPLKYRQHDEFAKLLVYDYFGEEYDYPQEIKLLGNIKEGKDNYYAFECFFTEEGEKKSYVGICGPFDNETEKLNFESYYSYSKFEAKEKDWAKQVKALIAEMREE